MKVGASERAAAARLLIAFERGAGHLDDLLDAEPDLRLRWLVQATFRDWFAIEALLEGRMRRRPGALVRQLLRLAVAECLNREPDDWPKVIHHSVDCARQMGLSKGEAGFVNAVMRGLARAGELGTPDLPSTHPEWLKRRWRERFGEPALQRLLEWNQSIPVLHVVADAPPPYARATRWEGFHAVERGRFGEALDDLKRGAVSVQDPFTRIPVELLDPRPGEAVMDLCAAPGGKSRLLAARMAGRGTLALLDLPGRRLERLRQNAATFEHPPAAIFGCPLERLQTDHAELLGRLFPGGADAVLIDVPCSNTGVIQKRPDVKVRLREADMLGLADQQARLLTAAARLVRPGGRLVYSTCSLEAEENAQRVAAFLAGHPAWRLADSVMSLPWECGHDGGGAFLLTRPGAGGR
jgi:16S rRNA (cytosine967-C5)-methyltransferase